MKRPLVDGIGVVSYQQEAMYEAISGWTERSTYYGPWDSTKLYCGKNKLYARAIIGPGVVVLT